ncbi:MAG: glutaredoxin domain-containing protein [Mesotoga sp.]|nr:glutaredoxin domain-containing protein [Mesotoga sp.]
MNAKVIVYSTPSCPWCKRAKDYFKTNGIPFKDFDVSKDKAKAEEMVKKSGSEIFIKMYEIPFEFGICAYKMIKF